MKSLPFVASDQLPAVIVPLVAGDLDELGRLAADCAQTPGIGPRAMGGAPPAPRGTPAAGAGGRPPRPPPRGPRRLRGPPTPWPPG